MYISNLIYKIPTPTPTPMASNPTNTPMDMSTTTFPIQSKPPLLAYPNPNPDPDIFAADRYFNNPDPILKPKLSVNSVGQLTPTASSKASWNSRSGLLIKPYSHTKKPHASRRLFGLSCPCSGKKAVDVKSPTPSTPTTNMENPPEITSVVVEEIAKLRRISFQSSEFFPSGIEHRIVNSSVPFSDGFTFPILTKPPLPSDDPPRDSLDVFQPKEDVGGTSPVEFRQWRSWEGSWGKGKADDDVASDSSSDLFEIESLSTTGPSYRRTECYSPSEASVEWSVTTAEGFANLSSAASEWEEAVERNGRRKGGGGGGLLSCRCEKAVSVGPNPVRFLPEQRRSERSRSWRYGRPVPSR